MSSDIVILIVCLLFISGGVVAVAVAISTTTSTSTTTKNSDCKVSEWAWDDCDVKTGRRSGTRKVLKPASGKGKSCGELTTIENCPVDCKVSDWSDGSCNSGTGKRTDTRTITQQALNGGLACGELSKTEPCSVDCKVSDWSWSTCNSTGKRTATRTIIHPALNGGNACGELTAIENCPVDCKVSDWSIGNCNSSGKRTDTRTIIQPALNGGIACGELSKTEPCSVDCKVSDWSWSTCNSTGKRTATRTVIQPALNGGNTCGELSKTESCPVDCKVSDWSSWSTCNIAGKRSATRTVIHPALNGGDTCGELSKTENCPIPIGCYRDNVNDRAFRHNGGFVYGTDDEKIKKCESISSSFGSYLFALQSEASGTHTYCVYNPSNYTKHGKVDCNTKIGGVDLMTVYSIVPRAVDISILSVSGRSTVNMEYFDENNKKYFIGKTDLSPGVIRPIILYSTPKIIRIYYHGGGKIVLQEIFYNGKRVLPFGKDQSARSGILDSQRSYDYVIN